MNIQYGYDPRQAILLDPKGNSIEVSIRPFAQTFNDEQQESIKFWLESHKRSEDSKDCYIDIKSDEKFKNMA
jgi:hypothetical protein